MTGGTYSASVTLELGGKSPVVIDKTADLSDAVQKISWGKFLNAGQTCVALDYVLIDKDREMKFLSLLGSEIKKRYGDSPESRHDNPNFPRLISDKHSTRLIDLLVQTTRHESAVIFGGIYDAEERYMEPTVLRNVASDSPTYAGRNIRTRSTCYLL